MWQQISSNKRKSFFFITIMAILMLFVGAVFGEYFFPKGGYIFGLTTALIVWIIICINAYYNGSNIFLLMSGAVKIEHDDCPVLFNVVEEMTLAAGLPKVPDVYILDIEQPNAFATGRDERHSAVVVTTGALKILNRDELQGVVAHEIAHILNKDNLFMLFAAITMGTIVYISDVLLRSILRSRGNSRNKGAILLIALAMAIIAPFFAQILFFMISRKREFLADACAAQFTRYPMGLANALKKISNSHIPAINVTNAMAAMYIVNPFSIREKEEKAPNVIVKFFRDFKEFYSGTYATHPKTEDRIAILSKMGFADVIEYNRAFEKVKHGNIINKKTLSNAQQLLIVTPLITEENTDIQLETFNNISTAPQQAVQEVRDLVHKINEDIIINCECNTILKIPKSYAGQNIYCPFCNKTYKILVHQKSHLNNNTN